VRFCWRGLSHDSRQCPTALKEKLPAPWQVGTVPAGPATGANLAVILVDQVLAQDPNGKPIGATGANRIMVLNLAI
jgi:hypothetical protein